MSRLFWHWIISAIALVLAVEVLPGVDLVHPWNAVWIAPLLGLVNLVVGFIAGILSWFTGPANLLTLGVFGFVLSFVLYTVCVYYLGHVPAGPLAFAMPVDTLPHAMLLAILMGLFSTVLNILLPRRKKDK